MKDLALSRLWREEKGPSVFLASILLFIFLVVPLAGNGPLDSQATTVTQIFVCLTAISGAWTVGWGRLRAALVTGVSAAALAIRLVSPGRGPGFHALSSFRFAIVLTALAGLLLSRVLREGPVTVRNIQGAIAAYLLFALVATSLLDGVLALDPGALRHTSGREPPHTGDLIFFNLVTLTTVGYGDLIPASPWARSIANLEGLVGQLYPAILIARLVSLEVLPRSGRE
jgi:hypothetical protein